MVAIVYFFIDLCALRRAPQDLPTSSALLGLVLVAGLISSWLLALASQAPPWLGLVQGGLDFALMLGVLLLALKAVGTPMRFTQTATALVGAKTWIGLIALLPLRLAVSADETSTQLLIAGILFLALVVWSVVVTAHILRHAFEIPFIQCVFIAITYDILSFILISGVTIR